jgi:hypothetical protein
MLKAFVMKNAFIHTLLAARDYQDRPEFELLCDWWREGGTGVCALVGIGGAGKTAIVERFLRTLPGEAPAPKGLSKRTDLPEPEAVFVFSFYEAPNPDAFFGQVHAWLHDEVYDESAPLPSYEQVLPELQRAGNRLLLVLDGLEKTQDDGARGGTFGQILDGRLRDLVLRAADGYLPGISLLITSRFPLWDISAGRCSCCRDIPIEQLDPATAVALLRKRGVHGTDLELEGLARDQGFHALTIDLMGGYIAAFCDGDLDRLKSLPHVPEDESDLDPRIAALREQERRFSRVAARYRESFTKSDPAALALLQRVCLFRLGVSVDTLAGIFLGEDKKNISGAHLAELKPRELRAKLKLLTGMRLLDDRKSANRQEEIYSLHPAVRDGFALDAAVAVSSHEAIRESLTNLLTEDKNPSDPAVLDLLEEIVYHTLSAGHTQEAWDIYSNRIGGYRNLGWRLGTYARGERICRAFGGGQPPETAPLPDGLFDNDRAIFINEWALYLYGLARLDAATRCFERNIELRMRQKRWKGASIGNQNLTNVHIQAGRLLLGLTAAEEAVRLAEQADDTEARIDSYAYRAAVRALLDDTSAALNDFAQSLHWQHKVDGDEDPLYSLRGIQHASLLSRLGQSEEAAQLSKHNIEILRRAVGPDNYHDPQCRLVLANIARLRSDLPGARKFLAAAQDWAIARDDKWVQGWAALVRARIERDADNVNAAQDAVNDGLHITRECGFGIHNIDLLLVQAELKLLRGDPDGAEQALLIALFDGIHPPPESGYPVLLAATDEECGYAWGISEGRYLLAQTYLLRVAQKHGSDAFVPARLAQLPTDIQFLISQARSELSDAEKLCRKLAPDRKSKIPLAAKVQEAQERLNGGVLTKYPLGQPQVFISHSSRDKEFVRKLVADLESHGVNAWLDERELNLGDSIVDGISKGLSDSDYLVVVLSEHSVKSQWVSAELNAALMEQLSNGGTVVIPVRIDDCEIPVLLRDRVYADFRAGYKRGLSSLLGALLQESPSHAKSQSAQPQAEITAEPVATKSAALSELSLGDLRRRICNKLDRIEVGVIWFDLFDDKMENDMAQRPLVDCVIELLSRAKRRDQLPDLLQSLAQDHPQLENTPLTSDRTPERSTGEPETPISSKRFHIALSFAGEYRHIVADVATALSAKIGKEHVFYDKDYEAELARPDFDTYLQHIYHSESELIVPFLCAEYERTGWCGLEWRAIRDVIAEKPDSMIMPFRFDDTHIPGLFSTDGYIDASGRTPAQIADLILQRLELNRQP